MNPFEGLFYAGFCAANPKNKTVRKWRRKLRLPNHAGLVDQRRCRASGTTIGLYKSAEAGLEADPDLPWATVCEDHGNIVCHATRKLAEAAMTYSDWCGDCQEKLP